MSLERLPDGDPYAVRLALDALREVGLVESRQGKGHFVRPVRAIGNRPFQPQRVAKNNQTFDGTGPNIKIRGSAHQIFERYVALAREAGDDRVAAENFYQHAEHYFRISNASREGNQPGTPPRPTTPSDVEMNSSEAGQSEVQLERSQPQGDDDQAGL